MFEPKTLALHLMYFHNADVDSRSMHLFYLKRSGDGGRGSLEMMVFLVKGWKLNLVISVKITQEHLWLYTLRNICRSRASGKQKGKVHGKNTTFYNSSMPGTVREKLSSRKFPDI